MLSSIVKLCYVNYWKMKNKLVFGIWLCMACTKQHVTVPTTTSTTLLPKENLTTDVLSTTAQKFIPSPTNYQFKPTLPEIDLPIITWEISVNKGMAKRLPSGSTIKIPPNAFIDKYGNPIEGKVNVNYREFHTSSEILASGIPMDYQDGNFESAGMFQLNASVNNEPVYLAKNKKAVVQLAMSKKVKQTGFKNYRLTSNTTGNEKWVEISNTKPLLNKYKFREEAKLNTAQTKERWFQLNYDTKSNSLLSTMQNQWYEYAGGFDNRNIFSKKNKWVLQHK